MNLGVRLGGAILFVAATAVVAALVHFCVVLVIPVVAAHDAYARLGELAPQGGTTPLPRAAPGERRFPWTTPRSPAPSAGSICRPVRCA